MATTCCGACSSIAVRIAAFATALDAFLRDLPVRPVLLGNVYDPTFGDDTLNFTPSPPWLARITAASMP